MVLNGVAQIGVAEEMLHHVLTLADAVHVLEREYHPSAQQARSHRTDSLVDHVEQTRSAFVHRRKEFETADSKLVEAHIVGFLYARYVADVAYAGVLRLLQIAEYGS